MKQKIGGVNMDLLKLKFLLLRLKKELGEDIQIDIKELTRDIKYTVKKRIAVNQGDMNHE